MIKTPVFRSLSAFLVVGCMAASAAVPAEAAPVPSSSVSVNTQEAAPEVTPSQFIEGLDQLVDAGKIKLLSSQVTLASTIRRYAVLSPEDDSPILSFETQIPRYAPRIGGAMWGWQPVITFNQTDQKAIKTSGAAAVTAMAAAAAALLAETVVGSLISAGVIAAVGGAASVYVGKNGICPRSRPTLQVGTVTLDARCV
ncbi:hypothetical protein [Actinomyces faecalis]|uniref:hypothetical protein n=1 Tax=Actinomyces faecalis TaxID=2722820 RepID=UPI001554F46E|nr:hypothetical protein [Actinomyces faecalis]